VVPHDRYTLFVPFTYTGFRSSPLTHAIKRLYSQAAYVVAVPLQSKTKARRDADGRYSYAVLVTDVHETFVETEARTRH